MIQSIGKLYFFRQFNARKSPLCWIWSMGLKNFQSQNIEFSVLLSMFNTSSFFFFFFMNTTKFLNLTTAPTCSSQSHIAMRVPCVSLSLHLAVWFLLVLSQLLLSISPQSSPHLCSRSSMDGFHVLFLTFQKEAGGGLVGQCLKVSSSGWFCPRPHTTHAHSPTHPEPLPVLQAASRLSALCRWTVWYLLYRVFAVPFVSLDTQILTVGYSTQYRHVPSVQVCSPGAMGCTTAEVSSGR